MLVQLAVSQKPVPAPNAQYITFKDVYIPADNNTLIAEQFIAIDNIQKLQRFDRFVPGHNNSVSTHQILSHVSNKKT